MKTVRIEYIDKTFTDYTARPSDISITDLAENLTKGLTLQIVTERSTVIVNLKYVKTVTIY